MKVSLLIPVCDSPFFPQAFDSAITQSHLDIEIVVCDDSSTDAAGARVAAARDPRVRYVRNRPALGFHGNFARCAAEARGDYLKFLNHDDMLRPDCVARMAAVLDLLPGVTLVCGRRVAIDDQGRRSPANDFPSLAPLARSDARIDGRALIDHCLVTGVNRIGEPSAVMFRRRDIDAGPLFELGGRRFTCLADLALWTRLLAAGDAFFIARALVAYRLLEGQLRNTPPVRTMCHTERPFLVREARRLGFLADPANEMLAMQRARAWLQVLPGDDVLTVEERALRQAAECEFPAE